MNFFRVSVFFVFVVFFVQNCKSENLKLLILHNNDMHARFEETSERSGLCKEEDRKLQKCVGGFARVAHVIREARKAAEDGRGPNVLYLNAGDTYTGSPWFSVHKWRIVSEFLNTLLPDAMSFGNHEFDLGLSGLTPFIKTAEFPIVAANLDFSKEQDLSWNISKSAILTVGEHSIGVIGYITGETAQISAPGKLIFEDEISSIKEESERLDKQGVKIIIALGHSGFYVDKKIAKEVPLVDLVIGGHTNTFLWNGPAPSIEKVEGPYPSIVTQNSGKEVPVVQAYAYTKYMGHLNIEFDNDGNILNVEGQPLLLNHSIPQDNNVLDLLNSFRPQLEALTAKVIGKSRVILDGDEKVCRVKECSFGNLITDAFVDYHVSSYGGAYWTDSPIGIINGGAIRSVIEPKMEDGSFTRGELLSAMPFGDQIFSASINGTDLLKALEIGVRANGKTSRGEFLQVSGIKYMVDFSKPIYSRVSDVKIRCGLCKIPVYEPIVLHKSYRILTTGFLLAGGDGHVAFRDKTYNTAQEDLDDIDIVARYSELKSPIYPGEEERILVEHIFSYDSSNGIDITANYLFVLISSVFICLSSIR